LDKVVLHGQLPDLAQNPSIVRCVRRLASRLGLGSNARVDYSIGGFFHA